MKLYVYLIIICLLFIIGFYFLFRWLAKHQIQQYKNTKFEEDRQAYAKELIWKYHLVKEEHEREIEKLDNEIAQKKEFNESMLRVREDELNRIIDAKRIAMDELLTKDMEEAASQVQEWIMSAQEAANESQRAYRAQLQLETEATKKELHQIQTHLDEYKEKQATINKEILRRRAIEEKEDFYRIQLDEHSIKDINILTEIKSKLNKINLLDKLIYENYIARPTKEMIKRVLEGKNPSGIYKVTNIKTKEIYIGKSVKIADRFINHVKSACGLEGVAESQFQRALKKYGVDSFTWELLEECPKENLTDREKYYIIFFETKEYGYNQREG